MKSLIYSVFVYLVGLYYTLISLFHNRIPAYVSRIVYMDPERRTSTVMYSCSAVQAIVNGTGWLRTHQIDLHQPGYFLIDVWSNQQGWARVLMSNKDLDAALHGLPYLFYSILGFQALVDRHLKKSSDIVAVQLDHQIVTDVVKPYINSLSNITANVLAILVYYLDQSETKASSFHDAKVVLTDFMLNETNVHGHHLLKVKT